MMLPNTLIIGNAAGTAQRISDVDALLKSAVTRITFGSITLKPRGGNTGTTYFYDTGAKTSYNSMGLPNMGIEQACFALPELNKAVMDTDRELRVSIAGLTIKEFPVLAAKVVETGVTALEVNLGCPNVYEGGLRKPIFSYRPDWVEEILDDIKREVGRGIDVGLKLSPIDDPSLTKAIARVIGLSGALVSEVVCCNTVPDQLPPNGALSFSTVENPGFTLHKGGMAGASLITRSLEVVKIMVAALPNRRVIGVGGIDNGETLGWHVDAGVHGFECGTALLERGPRVFTEILAEATELARGQ